MQPSARRHLIWMLIRTGLVLTAIVVVSVSFAWFRAAGAGRVGTEPLTVSAAEAEVIEIIAEGASVSIRGDYNGETGLGAEGTLESPFFISKQVTLTVKPQLKSSNITVPYTSIKTITITMGKSTIDPETENTIITRYPQLTNAQATTVTGVHDLDLSAFAWRIALLKRPYVKGSTGTAIANPNYVDPFDFSVTWNRSDPITTSDIHTYYNKEIIFEFDFRLYFLDYSTLSLSANARTTPFAYSGYDFLTHEHIDMTYCGATFAFDFNNAIICTCTRLVETGGSGS